MILMPPLFLSVDWLLGDSLWPGKVCWLTITLCCCSSLAPSRCLSYRFYLLVWPGLVWACLVSPVHSFPSLWVSTPSFSGRLTPIKLTAVQTDRHVLPPTPIISSCPARRFAALPEFNNDIACILVGETAAIKFDQFDQTFWLGADLVLLHHIPCLPDANFPCFVMQLCWPYCLPI